MTRKSRHGVSARHRHRYDGHRRIGRFTWQPRLSTGSTSIKNNFGLLVVGMDGRLIRRLDPGRTKIGDAGISPDGQTVLYWASDNPDLEGGAIYTLPMIGTDHPKQLTDSADGVDADPAWSPDGNQIAFRRKVPNPGGRHK